ncbi:MAG: hypothetical protein V4668_03560 [Patescibacteria group bacterium]
MTGIFRSHIQFRSIVYAVLIMMACTLIVLYVMYQARFLLEGPKLSLINEPESVQNSQVVHLRGKASNISTINLNGRQIFTDRTGYFDEALVLENGYNVATIQATDRYGRTQRIVKQFVYTPTSIIPL